MRPTAQSVHVHTYSTYITVFRKPFHIHGVSKSVNPSESGDRFFMTIILSHIYVYNAYEEVKQFLKLQCITLGACTSLQNKEIRPESGWLFHVCCTSRYVFKFRNYSWRLCINWWSSVTSNYLILELRVGVPMCTIQLRDFGQYAVLFVITDCVYGLICSCRGPSAIKVWRPLSVTKNVGYENYLLL
jgi:hypothetical protein